MLCFRHHMPARHACTIASPYQCTNVLLGTTLDPFYSKPYRTWSDDIWCCRLSTLVTSQHWIYFGNYGIHPINFISMIQSAYMLISYSGNIMEIFWKLFLNIGLASLWPMFTIFGKCLAQFFRSQLISVSEFCVFIMQCSRQC